MFQCCSARIVVGHEDERLPAVDGDGERRANGHLGAAADVPAGGRSIGRGDSRSSSTASIALLVVGLAVRERRLEPLEPVAREVVRDALGPLPLGVEQEELARELADRVARARLEVLPGLAAELRERRGGSSAPMCLELAELLVRDVQTVSPRKAGPRSGRA